MKTKIVQGIKTVLRHIKDGLLFLIMKVPKKYRVAVVILASVFAAYWIAIAGINTAWVFNSDEVTFQMESRERVERNGTSNYEVYTSAGVFSNMDSMYHFKRRSADLQNDLRYGLWYECNTQGFRFPWMHMMKNLIKCDEISDPGIASKS